MLKYIQLQKLFNIKLVSIPNKINIILAGCNIEIARKKHEKIWCVISQSFH